LTIRSSLGLFRIADQQAITFQAAQHAQHNRIEQLRHQRGEAQATAGSALWWNARTYALAKPCSSTAQRARRVASQSDRKTSGRKKVIAAGWDIRTLIELEQLGADVTIVLL